MAEFTPITTQEEFDTMIKSRLERERNTVSKQYEERLAGYADYESLKQQFQALTDEKASWESSTNETAEKMKALESQLTEANQKVKSYELDNIRAQAATANGIPFELRNRITGDTEEAINEDAKNLAQILKVENQRDIPSFKADENVPTDETSAIWKQMAKSLKGE